MFLANQPMIENHSSEREHWFEFSDATGLPFLLWSNEQGAFICEDGWNLTAVIFFNGWWVWIKMCWMEDICFECRRLTNGMPYNAWLCLGIPWYL